METHKSWDDKILLERGFHQNKLGSFTPRVYTKRYVMFNALSERSFVDIAFDLREANNNKAFIYVFDYRRKNYTEMVEVLDNEEIKFIYDSLKNGGITIEYGN